LAVQGPSPSESLENAGEALLKNFLGAMTGQPHADLAKQFQSLGLSAPKLAALQGEYLQQQAALWRSLFFGVPQPMPAVDRGDRRFASPEWSLNPWFDYVRQSYLINARFLQQSIESLEADPVSKDRMRFAARQVIDAMSPANFVGTNPEALQLAVETEGQSLAQGIRNLIEDMHKQRISTTDESVFEVGRNLGVTEGAVVFENELMQLLQYGPATEMVYKRPLLIVPPSINKFYILDLQPENSFVRYAVEQGHSVFMLSWRNITPELGHLTWDDYLEQGVLKAIEVSRDIGKVDKINALGFCVGGTMLGSALAIAAARDESPVESATLLASMLDFSDTGEIGLFVDEASCALREATIGKGGVMSGQELAMVFSALRANDLVWSYVVNNYLKGKQPDAFDLLYWNADSTNLPGPMYCEYVRRMYLENKLREPGQLTMLGVPVDLSKIDVPAYVLATRDDHIVPWRTAYQTTQLLSGDMRFVLGASGHIAGVVNPVAKKRRSYWAAEKRAGEKQPAAPEAWLGSARESAGSWWQDWSEWLAPFGGDKVKARKKLGDKRYKVIEPAPGRYVKQRT
jgi:polyhydroxyalkanoate synthase